MRIALVAITAAPAAPAPVIAVRPPRTTHCEDDFPKGEMIRDNIADTSVSGIAEIVGASRRAQPTGSTGYVNNLYELKVLKWVSGTGSEKQVLSQGAEADFKPHAPGTVLFFSACMSKDGAMSEPDVGYVFPVDPSCRAEVEKMGEAAAKRATAIGKRKKACAKTK